MMCCDAPDASDMTAPSIIDNGIYVCTEPVTGCGGVFYRYRYREAGTTTWIQVSNQSSNCRPFPNLNPCTEYEFQVQVYTFSCGAWSDFSGSAFFTTTGCDECCVTPGADLITVSNIEANTATVCSGNIPNDCGVTAYQFRYRPVGDPNWTYTGEVSGNCEDLVALDPCTEYEIQVSIKNEECGEWSEYSGSATFTTIGCSEECCEAPLNITVTEGRTAKTATVCVDAYDESCGQVFYHVKWREAGSTGPYNDFGGFSKPCRTIGYLEPCVWYEIIVYAWTEACDGFTSESAPFYYQYPGPGCLDPGPDPDGDPQLELQIGQSIDTPAELKLFPNPATDVLNINVQGLAEGDYQLDILNANGQVVQTQKVNLLEGGNNLVLDLQPSVSGSYILRLSNGTVGLVKQFTIK